VTAIIRSALPYFFPERLTLVKTLVRKKVTTSSSSAKKIMIIIKKHHCQRLFQLQVKLKKGNGGWGDKRDHKLCHNMTLPQR